MKPSEIIANTTKEFLKTQNLGDISDESLINDPAKFATVIAIQIQSILDYLDETWQKEHEK